MANLTRSYDSEVQNIGTGGGYVTLSSTTFTYSSVVDMNGKMGAAVTVEVNFDATPTDDVDVYVFPCRDSIPTYPDTTGKFLTRLSRATDPNQMTVNIPLESRYWRLGVRQTGSTDSHDVRAYVTTYTLVTS